MREILLVYRSTKIGKQMFVAALQESGKSCAFIGEKIFDSHALKEAHLGIAMG